MLINSDFEVAQPLEKVWKFFDDIPQVAACLPGAQLTESVGDDKYLGKVAIRMGPVKLAFAGKADIVERDEANHKVVVDAAGADERGRGQASMLVTAALTSTARGTKVAVRQDLQLSGAAAQYGRGMISDVTSVLMRDFATNMQNRIEAVEKGLSPDQIAGAAPASGLAIGLRAMRMALTRVLRRFFAPYQPARAEESDMVLWWIGNVLLVVAVVPILVALLNRVLAALERIRGASDNILAGGLVLIGELDGVPEALAETDQTIKDVATGAVRYAGSVAKLLG